MSNERYLVQCIVSQMYSVPKTGDCGNSMEKHVVKVSLLASDSSTSISLNNYT